MTHRANKVVVTLIAFGLGLTSAGCWEGQKPNPLKRPDAIESKSTPAPPDTAKKSETKKAK